MTGEATALLDRLLERQALTECAHSGPDATPAERPGGSSRPFFRPTALTIRAYTEQEVVAGAYMPACNRCADSEQLPLIARNHPHGQLSI